MEFNMLIMMFFSLTLSILSMGSLINTAEKYLPTFMVQTFRYGKFSYEGKRSNLAVEVPKKWFRHFYIFASAYSILSLGLVFYVYFLGYPAPVWFVKMLNNATTNNRSTSVTTSSVILAVCLLSIQCLKRFYETWFVSVFSDSRMNLSHYMIGYLHYFGAITAIFVEAPGFSTVRSIKFIDNTSLSTQEVIGGLLFLFACVNQYLSAKTLAGLRKNSNGNVITLKHSVPHGGLFTYVSSPHLLCEILMYFSLFLILFPSLYMFLVLLWVVTNQTECALLSHWWYLEKFEDYPKNRKAVIPFLL